MQEQQQLQRADIMSDSPPMQQQPTPPTAADTAARRRQPPITGRKRSAGEAQLVDERAQPAPSTRTRHRAATQQQAVQQQAVQQQATTAADEAAPVPVRSSRRAAAARLTRAAAAAQAAGGLLDVAEAGDELEVAEALAAAAGEPAMAEPAPAAGALPPHLAAVRAAVTRGHERNRQRIAGQRRRGVVKEFAVGDAVTLLPPKMGKVGRPVGGRRLTCRVVGITKPFGQVKKYKLRCNAGVLKETYSAARLDRAVPRSAAKLNFSGVEYEGLPTVSLVQAQQAEPANKPTLSCSCKGACSTRRCACMKQGKRCGRHCGCKTRHGANYGNH